MVVADCRQTSWYHMQPIGGREEQAGGRWGGHWRAASGHRFPVLGSVDDQRLVRPAVHGLVVVVQLLHRVHQLLVHLVHRGVKVGVVLGQAGPRGHGEAAGHHDGRGPRDGQPAAAVHQADRGAQPAGEVLEPGGAKAEHGGVAKVVDGHDVVAGLHRHAHDALAAAQVDLLAVLAHHEHLRDAAHDDGDPAALEQPVEVSLAGGLHADPGHEVVVARDPEQHACAQPVDVAAVQALRHRARRDERAHRKRPVRKLREDVVLVLVHPGSFHVVAEVEVLAPGAQDVAVNAAAPVQQGAQQQRGVQQRQGGGHGRHPDEKPQQQQRRDPPHVQRQRGDRHRPAEPSLLVVRRAPVAVHPLVEDWHSLVRKLLALVVLRVRAREYLGALHVLKGRRRRRPVGRHLSAAAAAAIRCRVLHHAGFALESTAREDDLIGLVMKVLRGEDPWVPGKEAVPVVFAAADYFACILWTSFSGRCPCNQNVQ
mmetsp:Transcript_16167/g.41112  ORF Transcript_16167/g.41112 Transcript_16167/m.41112 type:complete len:482 (+) Transcript_16167:473-1918(+)